MGASTRTTPTRDLIAEINELRTQRHAAILAHNYQRPEIQDIDDVGNVLDFRPLVVMRENRGVALRPQLVDLGNEIPSRSRSCGGAHRMQLPLLLVPRLRGRLGNASVRRG